MLDLVLDFLGRCQRLAAHAQLRLTHQHFVGMLVLRTGDVRQLSLRSRGPERLRLPRRTKDLPRALRRHARWEERRHIDARERVGLVHLDRRPLQRAHGVTWEQHFFAKILHGRNLWQLLLPVLIFLQQLPQVSQRTLMLLGRLCVLDSLISLQVELLVQPFKLARIDILALLALLKHVLVKLKILQVLFDQVLADVWLDQRLTLDLEQMWRQRHQLNQVLGKLFVPLLLLMRQLLLLHDGP